MYGFEADDAPSNSLVFGLNAGAARLTIFQWINNGGKDGAEGEALDIQFSIEGNERPMGYRLFPVTKAFIANNGGETTDQNHPDFKKAVKDFNQSITHIMHCFVTTDVLSVALGRPISNFKEFCKILESLLPKDFNKKPLDVFLQYDWQFKKEDQKMTYLGLPKKMAYGKWICPAVVPASGSWKAVKVENPDTATPVALKYVDGENNVHPFTRNGWFMLSNFANQQKQAGVTAVDDIPTGGTEGAAAPAPSNWEE